MPLQIIRQDITKMECDAIVNPSNRHLEPTGGADLAIHEAAGPNLYTYTRTLGGCPVGSAKITPAFDLKCKHIIHTAGPDWYMEKNPKELLISCYTECLKLAIENQCESLAVPLISAGVYGYPKDQVLKVAISTISEFLFDHELMVYLVVYDKKSYDFGKKLFSDIAAYIDDRYVLDHSDNLDDLDYLLSSYGSTDAVHKACAPSVCTSAMVREESLSEKAATVSIDDYIKPEKKFAYKLIELIRSKGMTNVECYKRANVSKQTWHKIETNPQYNPQKNTVISFAIALKLTMDEAQSLLNSVGFALSNSSKFDLIIMYCLEHGIYDIWEIDSILFKYGFDTLFSKA